MSRHAFRWWSLKTRTTLFTLGVFLVTIWSLFFYANRALREDMTRRFGEHQLSTASIVATAINSELEGRFEALREASETAAPLMSDPAALQSSLELQSFLRYLFNGGIIVTGPDGTAIGDLPRSTGRIGQRYGNDEWVSAALHEGRSTIGRPIIGKVLHVPVFAMTVPVRDLRGRVIGSMSGVVALDKSTFLDAIAGSNYGESGGFLLIASRHRLIVTASDKRRVMEDLPAPGVKPALDRLLERGGGTALLVNGLGEEVLESSSVIPATGWHFVVSLPTREAFAPLRNLQNRILIATLFFTLMTGCLTWWMLRRQLSPLTSAVRTLATFSDADRPVGALAVTRQDEVGELIGGFNRLLDTLGKREEALRESHATLRSILATTRDGYWQADRQGRLLDVNPTYTQQSGYEREELLGMQISGLEATESDPDIARRIEAIAERGSDQFETRHRRKDGSVWDAEVSVTYRDVDGGQCFAFIRDISERKRLEQARLTSQKLESLGTLTAGIAHDFNNILTAIVGNAHLAAWELGPEQAAAHSVEEIIQASSRASELVRRLVAFGRPGEVSPRVLDLSKVMEEVLELLRCTLPAGIALTKELAEGTPLVRADAGQVHEMIVNLTTNAAYAIGTLEGSIEYRLEPLQVGEDLARRVPGVKEGRYARLTVKDDGCGMDAATQERIFDAFFTTKPVGKGVGLGLSMVHGAMRAHGGAVTVESVPGKGSSFALYFPAANAEATDEAHEAPDRSASCPGQRILYVDDEKPLVSLAQRTLPRLGHEVRAFTDPRAALEAFRSRPQDFDVLVTDLSMPQMSGFDLTRKVLEVRPGMPVLMTTGYLSEEYERLAREAGIHEFVPKPVRMHELARVLRRILDRKTKGRGNGPATEPQGVS